MYGLSRWLAVATAGFLALPALAEQDPEDFNRRMLDVLLEQGAITQEQYDELSGRAEEEQRAEAEEERLEAEAEAQAQAQEWKFEWRNGFKLTSPDGSTELGFGGRIQVDGVAQFVSPHINNDRYGTEIRRARINFRGKIGEHLFFKAAYDFAGDNDSNGTDFKDVYVGLRNLGPVGSIRGGHMKHAFSFSQLSSSNDITFIGRELPVLALSPFRDIGIDFSNTAFDGRLNWAIGGFRSDSPDGEARFDNDGNYAITGRIAGVPVYDEANARVVHLAIAYSRDFRDERRFRARPEQNLGPRFVDTGILKVNGTDLLGAELVVVHGSWSLASEFITVWTDGRRSENNQNFYGAYVEVAWFPTGETKIFKKTEGVWGRTAPLNPFSLSERSFGAWEVAARYSHVHLGKNDGGVQHDMTLGTNWHLYKNLRLMLNYTFGHVSGVPSQKSGTFNTLQGRISLTF